MKDFDSSTLWEASGFERARQTSGTSGFDRLGGPVMLPATLQTQLGRRHTGATCGHDVLEVAATCMRQREAALLYLQCDGLIWPVTLFPAQRICHSPGNLAQASLAGLARITVVDVEPPGVPLPGDPMPERVAQEEHYRPLAPLLWSLALYGPRAALLPEIAGMLAYRALSDPADRGLAVSGALGPAVNRLQRETVSLRTICGWPGMSLERAGRLLNGLYLTSALLATRSHPAACPQLGTVRRLFSGMQLRP